MTPEQERILILAKARLRLEGANSPAEKAAEQKPQEPASLADKIFPNQAQTDEQRMNVDKTRSPVFEGVASSIDSLLNAPNNIMNLGRAAVGTVAGMMGRPDSMPELTPNPNFAARVGVSTGLITPQAQAESAAGRIAQGVLRGAGGMLVGPGSPIVNAGLGGAAGLASQSVKEMGGSDTAAQIAGMLVPPGVLAARAAAQYWQQFATPNPNPNAVRDETLRRARAEGYAVAPGDSAPEGIRGFVNRTLESIAGKGATRQDAIVQNQSVTNRVMARELGLPENTPITPQVLEAYRARVSQPYSEVAQLPTMPPVVNAMGGYPPQQPPAQALSDLRQARFDRNLAWQEFNRTGERNARADAVRLDTEVARLDRYLADTARAAGRSDLIPALARARTNIAKSYDIERALNTSTGDVAAPIMGRAIDRGAPLTGGAETVARFADAYLPYAGEASRTAMPGVSNLNALMSVALGVGGTAMAGPLGAGAAMIPFARGGLRSMLLSPGYQNTMGRRDWQPVSDAVMSLPNQTGREALTRSILLGRGIENNR